MRPDNDAQLVYVDASGIEGFPVGANPNAVIEVIDHRFHGRPQTIFPNASVFLEEVGAAATIIAERFRDAGRIPSKTSGTLLYGAIHSNTQNLIGSVTNIRDQLASQWLKSNSDISDTYLAAQFEHKTQFITSNLSFCLLRENKTFRDDLGEYNISQLEFTGATSLDSRQQRLIEVGLAEIGRRSMVNLVDITAGLSRLVVPDALFRAHIARALNLNPTGEDFRYAPAVLRKQIVHLLELYAVRERG
jgi:nanoRNase/pAp phosphatase (c-di-AMP/oligoRNAs hydrolase)